MKKTISDIIDESEIEKWVPECPVIIEAGTGVGKSHWVKNTLYDYARKHGKLILMLIHRSNCVKQFQAEMEEAGKTQLLDIKTYQKIEAAVLRGRDTELDLYDFIVCDEFHYFLADAPYNKMTDLSFKEILNASQAITIWMSATGIDVERYMRLSYDIPVQPYRIRRDWSFISELYFYTDNRSLDTFARELIDTGKKGIFFINSAEEAYRFYARHKDNALFCCSKSHKLYKYVDENKIKDMLEKEHFEENLLITTSCLDAGVNIKDPDVERVVVDIRGVSSLIQCIGRRRLLTDDDTVKVYVKTVNNRELGGMITRTQKELEMADFLLEHGTAAFLRKYPRQSDMSYIIYDEPDAEKRDSFHKRVNMLKYEKKQQDIKEYRKMLKCGEYGYCKYLARKFGKYIPANDYYTYQVVKAKPELEEYLECHVGHIMYTVKDRKTLIEKMNVRKDGHLLRSVDVLNASLCEEDRPYRIVVTKATRRVNGKTKKYKTAWVLERHNWEVTTLDEMP